MPVYIAEVLGSRHDADNCHMWPAAAVEIKRDRQGNAGHHARLDTEEQGDQDRRGHGREIALRIGERPLDRAEINQRQHGNDDGGGQSCLRQMRQQRGQEQGGQRNADGGEGTSRRGCCPGIEIDDRAGEPAGDRIATGNGGGNVGGTEADQLLIRLDPLTLLGCQRLRNGDGFHKTDDRNQQRGTGKRQPQLAVEGWQMRHRQAGGNVAYNTHAFLAELKDGGQDRGHRYGCHRPGLGQDIGKKRFHSHTKQQLLQAFAHPEEESRGRYADCEGDPVDLAKELQDGAEDVVKRMPVRLDAEDVLELAGSNQQARRGDEAGNHRMAQEVRQEAEPEQAHGDQHQAREESENDGGTQIFRGALPGQFANGGSRHQRDHGNRPDGQRTAGAEQGVGDKRQDGCIKADFRRQTSQKRVSKRLRDQHDRHDHRRNEIVCRRFPVIAFAPVENGQIAL